MTRSRSVGKNDPPAEGIDIGSRLNPHIEPWIALGRTEIVAGLGAAGLEVAARLALEFDKPAIRVGRRRQGAGCRDVRVTVRADLVAGTDEPVFSPARLIGHRPGKELSLTIGVETTDRVCCSSMPRG